MQRCFTNILSNNIENTAVFYEQIMEMDRHFDSDWFVLLTHKSSKKHELGILSRDHEFVPECVRNPPTGLMITFVVDDCDRFHQKAIKRGIQIVEPPKNMPYGQRRMLIRDPDGIVVDVSSPIS